MSNSDSIKSVILRRTESTSLGFSIMGGAGFEFPPVIYGIERDSPAARSGVLEAGDTILAINEREVVKLTTKEVLKCLRLSGDIVNIKYKRDPRIVTRVRQFLSTGEPRFQNNIFINEARNGEKGKRNCETFVMTGDAILNLSRQSELRLSPTTVSKLTPSDPPLGLVPPPAVPPVEPLSCTPPLPPPPPDSSSSPSLLSQKTVKSDGGDFPPPPGDEILKMSSDDVTIGDELMSEEEIEEIEGDRERYAEYILLTGQESDGSPEPSQGQTQEEPAQVSSSPDSSDVESLALPPVAKSVDLPSAERLAKRLYTLDGFKPIDIWRQLSKNNDFSRAVSEEYLKYFDFTGEMLDKSLRRFLDVCPLRGETQDRERVLTHFSQRWIECNSSTTYASADSVHTLACALLLLNTDMTNANRRMTCKDFVQNLEGLNDGGDFPESVLKKLYTSVKENGLGKGVSGPPEDEEEDQEIATVAVPPATPTKEFKRGYVRRKNVLDAGGKRTPFGRRSWSMHFTRLRTLLLCLCKDETRPPSVSLKLHHAVATPSEYKKRPFVFQLRMADGASTLFQCSSAREMNSWVELINLNAARYSMNVLPQALASDGGWIRPIEPSGVRDGRAGADPREEWVKEVERMEDGRRGVEALLVNNRQRRRKPTKKEAIQLNYYEEGLNRFRIYVDVLRKAEENPVHMEGD